MPLRERVMRRLFFGLIPFLLAAAVPSSAQQPPPQGPQAQETIPKFSAEIEQVTVDAVVTDKKGKPISGLTTADFTVLEDGVPQTLSYFEAVQLPETPAAKPPAKLRIATNTDPATRIGR